MRQSSYCDRCRREVPGMGTDIVGSIGMLALVQFRTTRGYFCRDCLGVLFSRATGLNLTVGLLWALGVFSGPLLTLSNLFPLIDSRKLPRPHPGASPPEVDDDTVARVNELLPRLVDDVERQTGDPYESATKLAPDAGIRPAQLVHALRLMAEAALPPPGGPGFEVILRHQPLFADRPPPTGSG